MRTLPVLATCLVALLIAAALAAGAWALTGSEMLGEGVLLLAINPVWLVVAWMLAPQLLRTK